MLIFGVQVTQSNLTIFLGIVGSFCIGLVMLYWRIKTFWYDQEQKFLSHVQRTIQTANMVQTAATQVQLDAQTTRIENCIHKMPGHPESDQDNQDDQISQNKKLGR